MSKKLEFGFREKDLDSFMRKIESTFEKIEQKLKDPKNFEDIVEQSRQGLRENREMAIENEINYAQMKYSLKQQGHIPHSTPLSVTGQLIDDYYMKLMSTEPDDLKHHLTFKNDPRMRPTYQSMAQVYRGELEALEYQESGSKDIVRILQQHKGYPILDTIYNVYSKDYEKRVNSLISDALKRAKDDSGN